MSLCTCLQFLDWGKAVVALFILGLLLAICVPVAGICVCCCRCCGFCGGNYTWSYTRDHSYRSKRAWCACITLTIVTIILLMIVLWVQSAHFQSKWRMLTSCFLHWGVLIIHLDYNLVSYRVYMDMDCLALGHVMVGGAAFLTHFSAGVVIAYISNTNARVAVSETPETLDSAFEDLQTYLATLQRVSGGHTDTQTHDVHDNIICIYLILCFIQ